MDNKKSENTANSKSNKEQEMADMQKDLMNYDRYRQQLGMITNQKQQIEMQLSIISTALTELDKTTEERIYKAVGHILILSKKEDVKKELSEQKESLELRVKTVEKQESTISDLLNKLRMKIEAQMKETEK